MAGGIQRLALLGARGVGKTHLHMFLSKGEVPEEALTGGVAPEKVSGRKLRLADLELKLAGTLDLPGSPDYVPQWKKLVLESDVVLYLFRIDHVANEDRDTMARIDSDLSSLAKWLENMPVRPKIFLVGTHADLDSQWPRSDADRVRYRDYIVGLPFTARMAMHLGGFESVCMVLGSMKDGPGTQYVAANIVKHFRKV